MYCWLVYYLNSWCCDGLLVVGSLSSAAAYNAGTVNLWTERERERERERESAVSVPVSNVRRAGILYCDTYIL